MSRRRAKPEPEDEAGDVLVDKIRGVLVGAAAGEALGAPVDGWTRDAILRRYGRVVHRLEGSVPGALGASARTVAEGMRALRPCRAQPWSPPS